MCTQCRSAGHACGCAKNQSLDNGVHWHSCLLNSNRFWYECKELAAYFEGKVHPLPNRDEPIGEDDVLAIMNKYRSLGFNQAKHNIKTQDAHPNPLQPNAVIVFVTGDLQIEGQEYPMKFAEVFHLVQTGGMCRPVMSFVFIFCFLGIQGPTNDTTKHAHNHRYFFTYQASFIIANHIFRLNIG